MDLSADKQQGCGGDPNGQSTNERAFAQVGDVQGGLMVIEVGLGLGRRELVVEDVGVNEIAELSTQAQQ